MDNTNPRPPATGVWVAPEPLRPEPTTAMRRPQDDPPISEVVDIPAAEPGLDPARWGWRGRANRLAGLGIPPGESEALHRAARRRLLRAFRRTMTVVVANPKGGAAKTPTSLLIAATLGFYRGGYTLAWDNNETRGTLGVRSEAATHRRTVADLLAKADDFISGESGAGKLSAYMRPQSARFDVLASDETPGGMDVVDDVAFGRLWDALSRYYRVLVVDTGNNLRAPNWQAATARADCLVVPTIVQPDVAESGLWMLDHLARSGRAALAENAIAVVSCADPQTDRILLSQIVDAYRPKVRDVLVIPHDPYVRQGGRIEYDRLAERTRRAWLLGSAAIVDSLALRDQD